jgi:hypothetical protein
MFSHDSIEAFEAEPAVHVAQHFGICPPGAE